MLRNTIRDVAFVVNIFCTCQIWHINICLTFVVNASVNFWLEYLLPFDDTRSPTANTYKLNSYHSVLSFDIRKLEFRYDIDVGRTVLNVWATCHPLFSIHCSIVNMCLICDKNNVRSVLTFSCLYDGLTSYLRYLCLCEYSGIQHILCDFCLSSSCVPNVASFPGLFIFDCPFEFLLRLCSLDQSIEQKRLSLKGMCKEIYPIYDFIGKIQIYVLIIRNYFHFFFRSIAEWHVWDIVRIRGSCGSYFYL